MPYGYEVANSKLPQAADPIGSLMQGGVQGLTLGLGLQKARQEANLNQLQQQAAQQEMQDKKMNTFLAGAEKLTTTKNKVLKDIYYQKIIKPIGADLFGVDFPDEYDDKTEDYYGALVEAKKTSKTPEEFNQSAVEILSRAKNNQESKEDISDIYKAAELLSPKKTDQLTSYQQLNQQNKKEDRTYEFRNRLVSSEPYKNFSDISSKASTIEKMVDNPGAFGDLGILFDYMKALDPTSVVREGEQERFKATGALTTRAANALNSLVTGKTLTPEQRQDVLKYTKMRQKSAYDIYKTHANPTIDQAKRLGLNSSEIDPYDGVKFDDQVQPKPAPYGNVIEQGNKLYRWNGNEYVEGE